MIRQSAGRAGRPCRVAWVPALVAAVTLFLPVAASAGGLAVTANAAQAGAFGLEVSADTSCTGSDTETLVSRTISGTESFQACETLTAGSGVVVTATGEATLVAGETVLLGDGFRVEAGGSLVAGVDPTLARRAYVQDDTPSAETTYHARFHVNLDGLSLAAGDSFEHFSARMAGAPEVEPFRLMVTQAATGPEIALVVRQDDGTLSETAPVPLAPGWNEVTVSWAAGAAATSELSVNGQTPASLSGLATQLGRVDSIRWGIVSADLTGTPGTLLQDDFTSWR